VPPKNLRAIPSKTEITLNTTLDTAERVVLARQIHGDDHRSGS
jgi:hypothetical protein